MLPPPAPTVRISSTGNAIACPPTSPAVVKLASPALMSETSKLVAPTSIPITHTTPAPPPGRPAEKSRRGRPAGGSGKQRAAGEPRRRLRRHHAAVRLHDKKPAGGAGRFEPFGQPAPIPLEHGPDVSVQRCGTVPLIRAQLRQHLRRQRHVNFREFIFDNLGQLIRAQL